jgi:hypothetical protein
VNRLARHRRRGAAVLAVLVTGLIASGCSEQVMSVAPGIPTSAPPPSSAAPPTTAPPSSTSPVSTEPTTTTTTTTTVPPEPTTSCTQVVHIGDSTGVPLFEDAGVGGSDQTATARYAEIGVEVVYPDNADARAIVERPDGLPNAVDVAESVRANGFDECWVVMVGTNDAAAIAAGSPVLADERIRSLMAVIGNDRVLWVDTVSQRTDDEYRNASMLAWNEVLYGVIAEFPNAHVFRWYDVVQPQWFRDDGIHYTVEGSAQRAALTAQALLEAFPAPAP